MANHISIFLYSMLNVDQNELIHWPQETATFALRGLSRLTTIWTFLFDGLDLVFLAFTNTNGLQLFLYA